MICHKDKVWFGRLGGKARFDEPLWKHCSFRIGGRASVWYEPAGLLDLKALVKRAALRSWRIFVAGGGNNVLFRDEGFDGVCVRLSSPAFRKLRLKGARIVAGSGVGLSGLLNFSRDNGLGGMEFLCGIPGTVGGALIMNAGIRRSLYATGDESMQEISGLTDEVKVMDLSGRVKVIKRDGIRFGYRRSSLSGHIVLEATFRLRKRKSKDIESDIRLIRGKRSRRRDYAYPSAGCVFRNPSVNISAGKLIDDLGFKGFKLGGAEVSTHHANFIINRNGASSADVTRIISIIREKTKKVYNINLRPEIIIV